MENITIGQIAVALAFVIALWGSIETISKKVSALNKKTMEDALKPTNQKLDNLTEQIKSVDLNATKNYLVSALFDAETGHTDPIAISRLYEQYEHYIKLGGNSYIKDRFEKLKKDGKI